MNESIQLMVLAKAPVPGRVKTRLCPPCTPLQAAQIAAAALADTLETVTDAPIAYRTLVIDGSHTAPPGWHLAHQRDGDLDRRLTATFLDTARPGVASMLIGMDTPQITVELIAMVTEGLTHADAVLAPATDGGWWALALRNPLDAVALTGVPMSAPTTGAATLTALRGRGLRVLVGPQLADVDTAADAHAVAAIASNRRFAAAVRAHLPAPAGHRLDGVRP